MDKLELPLQKVSSSFRCVKSSFQNDANAFLSHSKTSQLIPDTASNTSNFGFWPIVDVRTYPYGVDT